MVMNQLLRELDGAVLEDFINEKLIAALTVMNKYSIMPVYFMQFMISKINLVPNVILIAYDDRDLALSITKNQSHMHSTICDKYPKTITPTVLTYPQNINYEDVLINKSEDFYYSSSYIICGKELKNALAKKLIEITKIQIYSDALRKNVRVTIAWKGNPVNADNPEEIDETELNVILTPVPETIDTIKLPLMNYVKHSPTFKGILSEIANHSPLEYDSKNKEDYSHILSLVNNVKDEQMITFPNTKLKVFKDFIKQRPNTFKIWGDTEHHDEVAITTVCLDLGFNSSKMHSLILYRYLEDVVDSLNVDNALVDEDN